MSTLSQANYYCQPSSIHPLYSVCRVSCAWSHHEILLPGIYAFTLVSIIHFLYQPEKNFINSHLFPSPLLKPHCYSRDASASGSLHLLFPLLRYPQALLLPFLKVFAQILPSWRELPCPSYQKLQLLNVPIPPFCLIFSYSPCHHITHYIFYFLTSLYCMSHLLKHKILHGKEFLICLIHGYIPSSYNSSWHTVSAQ